MSHGAKTIFSRLTLVPSVTEALKGLIKGIEESDEYMNSDLFWGPYLMYVR